jgi:hypothetical protein
MAEDFIKQEFNPTTGRLIFVNTKTGKKGWSKDEVTQKNVVKANKAHVRRNDAPVC